MGHPTLKGWGSTLQIVPVTAGFSQPFGAGPSPWTVLCPLYWPSLLHLWLVVHTLVASKHRTPSPRHTLPLFKCLRDVHMCVISLFQSYHVSNYIHHLSFKINSLSKSSYLLKAYQCSWAFNLKKSSRESHHQLFFFVSSPASSQPQAFQLPLCRISQLAAIPNPLRQAHIILPLNCHENLPANLPFQPTLAPFLQSQPLSSYL